MLYIFYQARACAHGGREEEMGRTGTNAEQMFGPLVIV